VNDATIGLGAKVKSTHTYVHRTNFVLAS